jgi:hypothetical protein
VQYRDSHIFLNYPGSAFFYKLGKNQRVRT